ncbi:MAG: SDR family oxidoreductase [Christensenellaceae bacterium]|nr:SDR family oxidoreductase [Christensenellaceae bacterium]
MAYDRLKGKVALVTGSTRGIGRAIAIGYAREGAKVVVSGTNVKLCDEVVDIIKREGGEAIAIPCDVSDLDSVNNLFDKIIEHYGRLDVSVQNAGVAKFKPFLEMDKETLSKIWNINLYGTYFCAQRAAQIMVKQGGGGKIINMSSITSETGQVNLSAYAPTKGAISIMTKCMALEMAPYKINVNAIGPGTILTDINRDELDMEKDEREIPLGIGMPEDLVGIAILLATHESDYMTGHTVFVDGGYNIK